MRHPFYLTLEEQAEQEDEWRNLLQENTAKLTAREIIAIIKSVKSEYLVEIIERKYGL